MIDLLKEYFEKRFGLAKLELAEKTAMISGLIYFILITLVFFLLFIVLLIVGAGLWIGQLLSNYAYGLLIMSGVCLLVLIIVLLAKKSIQESAANWFIKFINK